MQNIFKQYIDYLRDNPKGLWFKRKLYGWGWTPAKWQGWVVIAIFVAAILQLSFSLPEVPTSGQLTWFFVKIIFYIAALIVTCIVTGEKPGWQWGKPKA